MSEAESKRIFQARFYELLKARGVSQKEIAAVCQVSKSTVSTWVNGQNMPRMDKLECLSKFFGVPKSYFIEEEAPAASREVGYDDFTYAMHNESRELPEEKKRMLLDMARFMRQELDKEKGGRP